MLRIIQMQVCKATNDFDEVFVVFGLGLDGVVYRYDFEEKHWNPITTRKVNPLHKQPKKQRIIREEGESGEV